MGVANRDGTEEERKYQDMSGFLKVKRSYQKGLFSVTIYRQYFGRSGWS